MNKKLISIFVVALIVAGVGSFFGGMKYAESKSPVGGNFKNLTEEQRAQMGANGRSGGMGSSTGSVIGEIIAKDDSSIIVQLNNGGSKIVFYSGSTQIAKTETGTTSDLEIGKSVTISGSTNDDGSVTAKIIQMRPKTPTQQ
ncbi:MAG: DUF5666 domain-containing protein [Candidatus Nealsonbacteria bacterium]|nr:DUF5666 domain-containing protein [Candidatus Nealsonbacteria bacterium]